MLICLAINQELIKYDNIKKTYEYLLNLDKSCYTFDYWINSIMNSKIYNNANKLKFPEIKTEINLDNLTIVADFVTSNGNMNLDKTIEQRNNLVTNSKCKFKNLFKCFCRKRNNIVDSA